MARAAYAAANQHGATGEKYDDWRRNIMAETVGCTSFTQCTQAHYATLESVWLRYSGDDAGAFKAEMKRGDETEIACPQTWWHLGQECRKLGDVLATINGTPDANPDALGRAYCCRIAEDVTRRPGLTWERLSLHSVKTHTHLVYTVRAAIRRLRNQPATP